MYKAGKGQTYLEEDIKNKFKDTKKDTRNKDKDTSCFYTTFILCLEKILYGMKWKIKEEISRLLEWDVIAC